MNRVICKTGRGVLVLLLALIPSTLLCLSLPLMAPPPPMLSPPSTEFRLSLLKSVPRPTSQDDLKQPEVKKTEPISDPPSPPDIPPDQVTFPVSELETIELPAFKPEIAPSPIKLPPVSRPALPKPRPAKETLPRKEKVEPEPVAKLSASSASAEPSPKIGERQVAALPGSDKLISGFEWGEIDQPPVIVRRFPPQYPYRAKRRGISGKVVVRFLINIKGRVTSPTIISAKPKGIFEKAVLACVKKWKFHPGKYQGRAVPTWAELPIRFKR